MTYTTIFSKKLAIIALVLNCYSTMPMERVVEENFLDKAKQVIAKNSGSFALGAVAGAAVTAGITYYKMRNRPIVVQLAVPEPNAALQVVPEAIVKDIPKIPKETILFKCLHGAYKGESLNPCRIEKYEFSPYSFDAIEVKNCINGDTRIYESERDGMTERNGMIKLELYKGAIVHGYPWRGQEQCIEDFDRVLSIKSPIDNRSLHEYNCMAVRIYLPEGMKDQLQILVSDEDGILYKKYKK